MDQVQDDLRRLQKTKHYDVIPADKEGPEELSGGGKYPCVECAKYFISEEHLEEHKRGKFHKKRLRLLKEPAYTLREAEMAAGMGSYTPTSK